MYLTSFMMQFSTIDEEIVRSAQLDGGKKIFEEWKHKSSCKT